MTACRIASVLWIVASALTLARADDEAAIKASLEKPVLKTGQALEEIKAFAGARIVPPPTITDRAEWEQTARRLRKDVLEQIVFRGAAAGWRDATCRVEWLDTLPGGPGYTIRKFRYEALPGMWIPALLYEPEKLAERVPLALHVNGHDPVGKAVDYKQMRSINLAKRGVRVLNVEWFGMGQLRTDGFSHGRMNLLELCGASGLAPFYLAMSRAIDLGLKLPQADPDRVAVSGLSGGGWQTILISSLDERVTFANPVAGYGSFHTNLGFGDMGDSEQAPTDMATLADYTHLTAMRAPRPTLLTYNAADDCCFKSGHTLRPLLNAATPAFALYGAADRLRSHVNHDPGTHNFLKENREQYYAAVGDFFFAGDASYPKSEIAGESELKTPEELNVPLPEDNLDFRRLASSLAARLPSEAELPTDPAAAESWRRERRERLKALLRIPRYEVAKADRTKSDGDVPANSLSLRLGDTWTVPGTELVDTAKGTESPVLLIADAGRASASAEAQRWRSAGHRVIAVDPLLLGESRTGSQDPDYTYSLFLASAGERPLGIQAAQLGAIARWMQREHDRAVLIVADGPRSSTAALVAAALEPEAIGEVELDDALASFKHLIDSNAAVEAMPELMPFGLLAECDVPGLRALVSPRVVRVRGTRGGEPTSPAGR